MKTIAKLMDIGPRDTQQDRAVAYCHDDGSWVIAVFDGLGGHARGDEAAHAAASAFPDRISSTVEMHAAVRTANTAVWNLVPEDRHVPRKMGLSWPARFEPLTTVAAAAWSAEGGLQTAWMGDSVLFFVPVVDTLRGMHTEPQGAWDSPLMHNALGFTAEPTTDSIGSMTDYEHHELAALIEGDGLIVIAATDGLFDPIRVGRYGHGGRFSQDPADNSIGFAIPADRRSSASVVADALMSNAIRAGLSDNAAVAVSLATL